MILSRLLRPAERLLDALADPVRREPTASLVIAGYVAAWTFYGVVAKSSQDIHFDMAELYAWSREPALGYAKHPPLAAWVVRGWFAIFPATDWAYYLLAMMTSGVALWFAWRLAARYLDGEKLALSLPLLSLIPLYSFHALKFNPNTVLLPLWAFTTLWFIRSFESRKPCAAATVGVAAAACMLGKYWSIFLLVGLALAALLDPRRKSYFTSAAPWITVAAGTLALAPHVVWLFANAFAPFNYALIVHSGGSIASLAVSSAGYLAGAAGYVALPVLLAFAAMKPGRTAVVDIVLPSMPERRLPAVAFWTPLLLPAVCAPTLGFGINSLWTMSAWTLLPVVLLSSPLTVISHTVAVRIVALAVIVPFAFLVASPFVAYQIHRVGVAPSAAHSKLLAEHVASVWRKLTDRPLQFISGDADLAYGVAFYVADHPKVVLAGAPNSLPFDSGVLVCFAADQSCLNQAGPSRRRDEIELSRSYDGAAGQPTRYVIIIVPPKG